MSTYTVSSPSYVRDLRILLNCVFAEPLPLPKRRVPGGPLRQRVRDYEEISEAGPTVLPVGSNSEIADQVVPPGDYWELALPHRLLPIGILLDITEGWGDGDVAKAAEAQVISAYRGLYHACPLPPALLSLLAKHGHDNDLLDILETSQQDLQRGESIEALITRRRKLRARIIDGWFTQGLYAKSVSVAELVTDVMVLQSAARLDLDSALARLDASGGSVGMALRSVEESPGLATEAVLPELARPVELSLDHFPPTTRDNLVQAMRERDTVWDNGLLRGRPLTRKDGPQPTGRKIDPPGPVAHAETREKAAPVGPLLRYDQIRDRLKERVIGRPDLCRELALVGAAHLHGLSKQRVLITGPSGSGKSHSARALADVIGQPCMHIDMGDISGTGWAGGDLPDLVSGLIGATGDEPVGILILDEIDKVRLGEGSHGNSLEAKMNIQSSLLGLCDGREVTPGYGSDPIPTDRLLVIGCGAFQGRFEHRPPTTAELTAWGWIPELAARWGHRLSLPPLTREDAVTLLRSSDRSVQARLGPVAKSLGLQIEVSDEVIGYVVTRWLDGGSDFRSAAGWLLAAARRRMIQALEDGLSGTIRLSPDDVVLPSTDVRGGEYIP